MSTGKRHSKLGSVSSRNASTSVGSYIITPKSIVCPGKLSKNVTKKFSLNPSIKLQQKNSSKSLKEKISKPNVTHQIQAVTPKSSLVVSQTQCIVEIHLKHLDLSDTALKRMEHIFENTAPTNIRISWKFLSFDRSAIPLSYSASTHYDIESSVLYKVDMNDNFFDYVLTRDLSLELYASAKQKEVFLARGELKLSDILEYPLNELYSYIDLCDVDKALVLSNTGIAVVYGTLTVWSRLNCDTEILNTFLKRFGHIYYSPSTDEAIEKYRAEGRRKSSILTLLRNPELRGSRASQLTFQVPADSADESESFNSLEPTDSEMESFQEALDLVLSRNKALRTTQSEISNELNDRARWLHEESNWKRTLQEHAILCGKDPTQVEWRQWRDENTAVVKLRNYPSQVIVYEPEVVVTIEYLKLYKSSPPVKNNKYKQLYVEYSFLTLRDLEIESSFSVEMPKDGKKMIFNFTQKFSIDPNKNPENSRRLAQAVKDEEEIKFVVVGEPVPEPNGTPCCEEVSTCSLNMLELVQMESNDLVEALPLHDLIDESNEIGYLKIRITGIQAMRRQALQFLAPPDFNIL